MAGDSEHRLFFILIFYAIMPIMSNLLDRIQGMQERIRRAADCL